MVAVRTKPQRGPKEPRRQLGSGGLVKRADVTEAYYFNSGAVSTAVRTLAVAGLALVWVFHGKTDDGTLTLTRPLLRAAVVFALSMAVDLTQYVVGTLLWKREDSRLDKLGKRNDDEVEAPKWIPSVVLVFFWAKLACLALAYYLFIAAAYDALEVSA